MNIGYFASFTVFLALNDADFCNAYLRSAPRAAGPAAAGDLPARLGLGLPVVTPGRSRRPSAERNFRRAVRMVRAH